MKYTLLELTQSVLSSIGGDEITSISDTTESDQIVEIIKTVYDDIQSRGSLPIQKTLFNLDESGDVLKPVLMTKPTTIENIDWIRYNRIKLDDTDPAWADVQFLPIDQFMMMMQSIGVTDSDVGSMSHAVGGFTFTFYYKNTFGPSFYTTFDDNTVIFDSYDVALDTTLLSAKTLCYGTLVNTFTKTDGWTPNLQSDQFPLLLSEATSLAWVELKQSPHAKAEQSARRNWRHLSRNKKHVPTQLTFHNGAHPIDMFPSFGRR